MNGGRCSTRRTFGQLREHDFLRVHVNRGDRACGSYGIDRGLGHAQRYRCHGGRAVSQRAGMGGGLSVGHHGLHQTPNVGIGGGDPSQSRTGKRHLVNFTPLLLAGLVMAVLTGQAGADRVRFATFNASMSRGAEGELAVALRDGADPQIAKIAAIIRAVDPDVVLVNEFDYGAGHDRAFVDNWLGGDWPFSFIAPSNTGLATGRDLDGDGIVGSEPGTMELARDSHGFGTFEGQYGMVVLSKHEIALKDVRTFRTFLWRDMPGARLPVAPDGTPFYSDEVLGILRLSSKSHWDVPVRIGGEIVHFLVSHPTPPVFDGPEDRNGTRNADEIRFWSDYIAGAEYIEDDSGAKGGLPGGARFVIAGDLNADPVDGESVPGAIRQLLEHPLVDASMAPSADGAAAATEAQGGSNSTHRGDPRFDTADFDDEAPGNLRVDYLLPSAGLEIVAAGVFWPGEGDPGAELLDASDHRLVWIDITLPTR